MTAALLIADALRFTPNMSEEQRLVAADLLRELALGECTEERAFRALLDAGFSVTAPFRLSSWIRE